MKIAVIGPILNEAEFVWASIMAVHPYVEEFVFAVSPKSSDGTIDILRHIAKHYGKVRILLQNKYDFDPMDMKAYNASYNDCLEQTRCEATWFLHPDMVVTNPEKIMNLKSGTLAWTVNMTSYARDFKTVITKGRVKKWKSIHSHALGLTYWGGYGSQDEDFYFSDITGTSHKHFGSDFSKYPYEIADSGIDVNHYCELKPYLRRLEKMRFSLRNQHPDASEKRIQEMAANHPRVTLEPSCDEFGAFQFEETQEAPPSVFEKYRSEFQPYVKGALVHV